MSSAELFNKLMETISYACPNNKYYLSECVEIDGKKIYYNYNNQYTGSSVLHDFLTNFNKEANYSLDFLKRQLDIYLLSNPNNASFDNFNKIIKGLPVQKYFVYVGLYGTSINDLISLGKFKILDKTELTSYIKTYENLNTATSLTDSQIEEVFFKNIKTDCFIGIEVAAYDDSQAQDLARQEFLNFEKLMNFCCVRNHKRPSIKIFNLVNRTNDMILLKQNSIVQHSSLNSLFVGGNLTIPFSQLIEEIKENKLDCIFDIYSMPNKNEIQRRIINAILWMGMANVEENNQVRLLEYCFALESILQQQQNSLVSPSINYQISTACAIIIENNYNSRRDIAENIKEIYKIRSAIAHGGIKQIDEYHAEIMWRYLVSLILELLLNKKWNKFEKIDSLLNEVESIKLGKKTP